MSGRSTAPWAIGRSVRLPKLEHTKPGTFSAHGIGSWEDGDTTVGVLQLDDALRSPLQVYEDRCRRNGSECHRGARDVIRHCRPVLNVENDRREKLLELIRLLQEMDYSLGTRSRSLILRIISASPTTNFGVSSPSICCVHPVG